MPTETIIFLSAALVGFGIFAATLFYVDLSTKATRKAQHPIPGE